jgi:phage gpG-like protein
MITRAESLQQRELLELEESDPDKIADAVRAYLSENLGGV